MTEIDELFAAATEEQWEQLVRAKAHDQEAPLSTELEDGLAVKWLYTERDAIPGDRLVLPARTPGTPWAVRQQVAATNRGEANSRILEELEGGADEVLLVLDPGAEHGIPALSPAEFEELLVGVHLNMAGIALDSSRLTEAQAQQAAEALAGIFAACGHPPDTVRGSLGLTHPGQIAFAADLQRRFPHVKGISIDTGRYVDAGAGVRDELALALASGAALLRSGADAGLSPAQTAASIEFTLVAGADQFLEICKLRAARRLWARALSHCGLSDCGRDRSAPAALSTFYARTSRRMMSSLDPWVNILRATSAAFAAGVGGADGVTVVAFDEPHGETLTEPGPLGRRIARNTQLLLQHESHLHRVADPAAGSWYVESLTEQLAASAWERFQQLEAAGGIEGALAGGRVSDELAAATAARHRQIATRRRELTGVNTFPLLGDDGLERDRTDSAADELPEQGGAASGGPAGTGSAALVRDAGQFEHLRARAARLSPPPRMFLACMGPLAAHVTIAQWAKNFFEAGGIETVPSGPLPDSAAQIEAFRRTGTGPAAVCPGKGTSAADQAQLLAALRAAGAKPVYLAGCSDEAARLAGADAGAEDGMDMVAVLGSLLDSYQEAAR